MTAPSFPFLAFDIAGAILFNLSAALAWRRWTLLALNLAFFTTFLLGAPAALPYAGFLVAGYLGMQAVRGKHNPPLFLAALGVVLASFFWLKRYTFIPSPLFLPFAYTTIGLSYVFFRVLHLVIESRAGTLEDRPSPLAYLNYVLHFPALIAGPIQLYPDYRRMEREERLPLDILAVGESAWRIVLGFFKVAIVSALLGKAQHASIAALADPHAVIAQAAISAAVWAIYPLFLYANFSGYTDFVIGIAQLYRFVLSENFDRPFTSENFITFWSRWHITLSNWLKTYVYMPILVTGMRRFPTREIEPYLGVVAYFVTFFLVGAWHGQTATFLFFGVLQGGGVAANKLYQIWITKRLGRKGYRALAESPFYRAVCRGLTFTWFAFTLLWFWSSWSEMGRLAALAGGLPLALGAMMVLLLATILLAAGARLGGGPLWRSRYTRVALGSAMAMVILVSTTILAGPATDIVYKNF